MRWPLSHGRRCWTGPRPAAVGVLVVCVVAAHCVAVPTQWAVFGGFRIDAREPDASGGWSDIVDVAGGPDGLIFVAFDVESTNPALAWGRTFPLNPAPELIRELLGKCGFWSDRGGLGLDGAVGHYGPGMCEPCMYDGGRQVRPGLADAGDWAVFVWCCFIRGELWNEAKDMAVPSGGVLRLMGPDPAGPVIMAETQGLYPSISTSR